MSARQSARCVLSIAARCRNPNILRIVLKETNVCFTAIKQNRLILGGTKRDVTETLTVRTKFTKSDLKENSGVFKPRPYFWHEIRSSIHREQFGESRRPSEDI